MLIRWKHQKELSTAGSVVGKEKKKLQKQGKEDFRKEILDVRAAGKSRRIKTLERTLHLVFESIFLVIQKGLEFYKKGFVPL